MTAHAKKCFRPTLETLENREMMDAGIGGAVMHPMMLDTAQGAQVRLLAQAPSALQNPNNPLSQSLTQANQAFLAQSQQVKNLQAAVDHIFSSWSQHVDQVVHNIPGLQAVANYQQHKDNPSATLVHTIQGLQDVAGRKLTSTFGELSQGDQQYQLEHGPTSSGTVAVEEGKKVFDVFNKEFAQAGKNSWGIVWAEFVSAKEWGSPGRYQVDIKLRRLPWFGQPFDSTLSIKFVIGSGTPWSDRSQGREVLHVKGSDVTTDGKPDASLALMQGALLLMHVEP